LKRFCSNYLRSSLVISLIILHNVLSAQTPEGSFPKFYKEAIYAPLVDALRIQYGKRISYKNKKEIELGTLLAISHYPELQTRKVKVIIKNY